MSKLRTLFCILLLPLIGLGLSYGETVASNNVVVVVAGSDAVLTCETANKTTEVRWRFRKLTNSLFNNLPQSDRLKVQSTSLIIKNTSITDVGWYRCEWDWKRGDTKNYTYALIIFHSQPVFMSNVDNNELVENETLTMNCSFTFTGSLKPRAEWSLNGHVIKNETSADTDRVTWQLEDKPTVSDVGRVYALVIKFDNQTVFSHNSSIIHVLYPVRNVRVVKRMALDGSMVNQSLVYYVGEEVDCQADGQPTAEYRWLNLETNKTSSGPRLKLTDAGTYKCTTSNVIRAKMYTDVIQVKTVLAAETKQQQQQQRAGQLDVSPVLFVVVVFLLLVAVAVIIWLMRRKRENTAQRSETEEPVEEQVSTVEPGNIRVPNGAITDARSDSVAEDNETDLKTFHRGGRVDPPVTPALPPPRSTSTLSTDGKKLQQQQQQQQQPVKDNETHVKQNNPPPTVNIPPNNDYEEISDSITPNSTRKNQLLQSASIKMRLTPVDVIVERPLQSKRDVTACRNTYEPLLHGSVQVLDNNSLSSDDVTLNLQSTYMSVYASTGSDIKKHAVGSPLRDSDTVVKETDSDSRTFDISLVSQQTEEQRMRHIALHAPLEQTLSSVCRKSI